MLLISSRVDLVDFTNAEYGTLSSQNSAGQNNVELQQSGLLLLFYWVQITNRFTIGKKQGDYWIFHNVCTQVHVVSLSLSLCSALTTIPVTEQTALVNRCVGVWCMAGSRSLTLSYGPDICSSNPFFLPLELTSVFQGPASFRDLWAHMTSIS